MNILLINNFTGGLILGFIACLMIGLYLIARWLDKNPPYNE